MLIILTIIWIPKQIVLNIILLTSLFKNVFIRILNYKDVKRKEIFHLLIFYGKKYVLTIIFNLTFIQSWIFLFLYINNYIIITK